MKLKKLLILILMFVMATSAIFAQNNIAVSTFDIAGGAVSTEEAEAITELFIAELVSTGKVTVVDRANFDKIIKEMKFQASDWSNKEKTVALGNAINATNTQIGKQNVPYVNNHRFKDSGCTFVCKRTVWLSRQYL